MEHAHDAESWDRMYRHRQAHAAWSGEPNPLLAQEIAGVEPGTALDLACGEGADALWLTERGWKVTAIDLSNVALDRARAADASHRVDWIHADMLVWQPPADAYDLVSLHYVHIPPAERAALFGRLARAVRPNGFLLVVAHHPSEQDTTSRHPAIADLYYTADDVAASLAPGRWEILCSDNKPRHTTDHEGRPVTRHDTVLKARRLE